MVSGTLKPDGTLELDQKPNLRPGPVRVTLEMIPQPGEERPDIVEVLDRIRKDQEARGYKGMTEEEMEAEIAAMRAEDEEYEERWRQIWAQTQPSPRPEEKP
jgi:hypothetical protein